ncbi:MAG: glycosyltransferase family 4 protein [Mesorhizobium sp.]
MKIVQVQTQAEAAGAQRVSDMVGEGLRARGHAVRTVFMYRKTAAYDNDPHADFVLSSQPGGLPGQMRAAAGLVAYMRRERPDAVISYQHYGNIFGTLAARLAGARHIVANQSGAPQSRGVMGLLSSIDKAMGVLGAYQLNVVNSAWTEGQFDRYPQAYKRRMRRIDHGVPGPPGTYDKREARAAFGLPQDAWLAVTTGRLTRDKNHLALAGALCRLNELHVAIAGAGPERETLTAFARENGVADRLHFVGEVPPARIFEFLSAGDVFAFPSVNETFGLSVAEAAIAGLPVVANGLPVLREVLSTASGEPAALFVDGGDAAGFAAALEETARTPGLADKLSENGRRLAERYSPAAMCLAYEKLLA